MKILELEVDHTAKTIDAVIFRIHPSTGAFTPRRYHVEPGKGTEQRLLHLINGKKSNYRKGVMTYRFYNDQ